MPKLTDKEYFADTTALSNSQLRTFISYNKYGQKLLCPDDYLAMHVDKKVKFNVTDPVVIWKIVDRYFDGEGQNVWSYFIPVARRTWKEIQKVIDKNISELWENPSQEDIDRVTEEVNENYWEITMAMKETADEMITRGLAFRKFTNFLKADGTEAQAQLREKVEVTDSEGTIHEVLMKGKPDFVNEKMKLVVDLKTTGSRDMIIDELQFRGEPKLTANYIRQLSGYNKMMWGDYDGALALVTATGVKWIHIPNQILVDAWEILWKDYLELDTFIKNPDSLDESIFKYDESLDALSL